VSEAEERARCARLLPPLLRQYWGAYNNLVREELGHTQQQVERKMRAQIETDFQAACAKVGISSSDRFDYAVRTFEVGCLAYGAPVSLTILRERRHRANYVEHP